MSVTLAHDEDPNPAGVRVRFGRERGGRGQIGSWGNGSSWALELGDGGGACGRRRRSWAAAVIFGGGVGLYKWGEY